MAQRSALDRLSIAAVVIAGVVEAAQQALINSPDIRRTIPALNLTGLWNYVPFALIFIAGSLWVIDRMLTIGRGSRVIDGGTFGEPPSRKPVISEEARKLAGKAWKQLAIWGSVFGVAVLIFLGIKAIADKVHADNVRTTLHSPPVIQAQISYPALQGMVSGPMTPEIEKTLNAALNQTARVSGFVDDVRTERSSYSRTIFLNDMSSKPRVYLVFTDEDSSDVQTYSSGDHIQATCKIERLDKEAYGLNLCRVEKLPPAKR